MSTCDALDCAADSAMAWERWATQAEVDQYHASGDLPAHEATAKILVRSCAEHLLHPVDLMSRTHDAECGAPSTCNCSVGS